MLWFMTHILVRNTVLLCNCIFHHFKLLFEHVCIQSHRAEALSLVVPPDEIKEGNSWLPLPRCCPVSEAKIGAASALRGQGATKQPLCLPLGWCWHREGRTGQWPWWVSVRGGISCLESTCSLTNHFHMVGIRLFRILFLRFFLWKLNWGYFALSINRVFLL